MTTNAGEVVDATDLPSVDKVSASDVEKELLPSTKTSLGEETFAEVEGGYGWVIVGASFFGQFVDGLCIVYGLFHVVLLEQFGRSPAETSMIGSLSYLFTCIMGPFGSFLCGHIGHRKTNILGAVLTSLGFLISAITPSFELFFFSYGFLLGTGMSFQIIACSVLIQFYFKKRMGLVIGITRTGAGVGTLIMPPLTQLLIDHYSWRGAMLFLAGISLQGCVIGALLRPNAKSKRTTAQLDRNPADSFKHNLKSTFAPVLDVRFFICLFMVFAKGVHTVMFYYLVPDQIIEFGFTAEQAAFLLLVAGISTTLTRTVTGVVSNFVNLNYTLCYGFAYLISAISNFGLLLNSPGYGFLAAISILYGIGMGINTTILSLLLLQLFGVHGLTFSLGWAYLAEWIGGFVAAPIGGALFSMTGSYAHSFLLSGVIGIIASVLTIPVCLIDRNRKNTLATNFEFSGLPAI